MEYKPLPVGIDNFEKVITQGYYYVDKTLLIKELLDKGGEVTLFTRPRRFGKSLNISMLQHFFEKSEQDRSHLFDGLKIMEAGEKYTAQMGKYPVIKFTLKSVEGRDFDSAFDYLKAELTAEFAKHDYLLKSPELKEKDREEYQRILSGTALKGAYERSLQFLSECLAKHHKTKTIILIDEYDVPLEKAYFKGYYDEMIATLRSMYNKALKTNDSLHFAVLTGCLRISKESIFTGLNNLKVMSILTDQYDEFFGFTKNEMMEMLSYYNLSGKMDVVREWYDGYVFGSANVYNPWSAIMYADDLRANINAYPKSYWSTTSSNSIVRDLIEMADAGAREEIEYLIQGGSITKPVHEDITYAEIRQNMDNLWNFLFFTGYLKKTGADFKDRIIYCTLTIPNEEVLYIYENKIRAWFDERVRSLDSSVLLEAITSKDTDALQRELNKRLMETISYHDSAEAFYHGFLLGILSNANGYSVKSNQRGNGEGHSVGTGRSDIFLKPLGTNFGAAVFELKFTPKRGQMEALCQEALDQIEEKAYIAELEEDGYKDVLRFGVTFYKKECMVDTR